MRYRSRTLARELSKSALASLEREASGDSAKLAFLKMRALYGREVLSRRAFLENCVVIQDKKTGEFGPWWLNSPQRAVEAVRLRTVRSGRLERYATLKARKWGISTLWLGYGLEMAERTPGFQGAIIGENNDAAAALLHQGKQMRTRQPFKLVTKYDNRSQLYFAPPVDSSLDIESAKNADPLRGRTIRFVHGTEPQLWDDANKKRAAIENAVPDQPGTVISYEGTGFGRNWWYEFWWAARRNENGYIAIFLPWIMDRGFDYCLPEDPAQIEQLCRTLTFLEEQLRSAGASWGQILWRRAKIAATFAGDERMFAQEFPLTPEEAFMADGRPAFNQEALTRAELECKAPIWRGEVLVGETRDGNDYGVDFTLAEDQRGPLKIWEQPKQGEEYAIGSDSGQGIGQDNSAAYVINNRTGAMCAAFVAKDVEPRPFGKIVAALGRHYNWAYAYPEVEGPGNATLDGLKEVRYPKIGTREQYDNRGKVIGQKLGFSTNTRTRPIMFNEIRANLADAGGAKIFDLELVNEMFSMYRDESGKECAPSGKKDDRVIAWGVALMARRESKNPVEVDYTGVLPQGSLEQRHWREYERQTSPAIPEEDPW